MAFVSSWLTLGPRITKQKNKLKAVSGWRVWLLTFGLLNRMVIIDTTKKVVRIQDRLFWLFPSRRTIKFTHIRAIAYGHSDPVAFGGLNLVRDTIDVYRVGLKLHGDYDNYVHLFRFSGEGSFVNDGPLPDWFYWDEYLFDLEGTQGQESKLFVELLMKMIQVPLEPI